MKKKSKWISRLRNNSLIDLLFTLEGNPKVLILLEPLWGIPYYLINPYASLYMRDIGLSKIQIGSLQSIFMISQVIIGLFAGALADKFGRKKTTVFGDFFGWSVAMLMFAISNNYWMFVLAYFFNSFEQINQTSWVCLLVEDAKDKDILNIHNWVTIGGMVAVIFAPLSGLFINHFSIVPVLRVLYVVFSINMFFKSYITLKYCTETQIGKMKMAENKNESLFSMVKKNYSANTLKSFFAHGPKVRILLIQAIYGAARMIMTTFTNIYAKEQLNVPETFLSFIPIISTGIMILFMFGLQDKIKKIKIPMVVGTLLYIGSQLMLIVIPKDNLLMFILYTVVEAVCFALVFPRKSSLETFSLDKNDRARELALLTTLTLVLTSPFGSIAGALSELNPILPFILNMGLFALGFLVLLKVKEPDPYSEAKQEIAA
jgi:MFS family permease